MAHQSTGQGTQFGVSLSSNMVSGDGQFYLAAQHDHRQQHGFISSSWQQGTLGQTDQILSTDLEASHNYMIHHQQQQPMQSTEVPFKGQQQHQVPEYNLHLAQEQLHWQQAEQHHHQHFDHNFQLHCEHLGQQPSPSLNLQHTNRHQQLEPQQQQGLQQAQPQQQQVQLADHMMQPAQVPPQRFQLVQHMLQQAQVPPQQLQLAEHHVPHQQVQLQQVEPSEHMLQGLPVPHQQVQVAGLQEPPVPRQQCEAGNRSLQSVGQSTTAHMDCTEELQAYMLQSGYEPAHVEHLMQHWVTFQQIQGDVQQMYQLMQQYGYDVIDIERVISQLQLMQQWSWQMQKGCLPACTTDEHASQKEQLRKSTQADNDRLSMSTRSRSRSMSHSPVRRGRWSPCSSPEYQRGHREIPDERNCQRLRERGYDGSNHGRRRRYRERSHSNDSDRGGDRTRRRKHRDYSRECGRDRDRVKDRDRRERGVRSGLVDYYDSDEDEVRRGKRGSSRYLQEREGRVDTQQDSMRPAPHTWNTRATPTILIKGIPEDKEESDIYSLLSDFPNVKAVRLVKDRATGASRGFAFIDFEGVDDTKAIMETRARYSLELSGCKLTVDYAQPLSATSQPYAIAGKEVSAGMTAAMEAAAMTATGSNLDWVCRMCNAVNFARRLECYQCSCVRPANPQRVALEPEGPSTILKVSALEPQTSEETLYHLCVAHAPVKDIRLVRDKFTGAPRGFAFVELNSVVEAAKLMAMLQNAVPDGQTTALKICYARDRAGAVSTTTASSAGADAVAAAQTMQHYSGWEPKAFDAAAVDAVKQQTKSAPSQIQPDQSSFTYDSNTGYWYDSASGYYYDANTGQYYHPSTNQWYYYDSVTGQYKPSEAAAADSKQEQASQATAEVAKSAMVAAKPKSSGTKPAAAFVTKPATATIGKAAIITTKPEVVQEKKKGAVIGAAPQLNPHALLLAAQQEEERGKEQQRQAMRKKVSVAPPTREPQQQTFSSTAKAAKALAAGPLRPPDAPVAGLPSTVPTAVAAAAGSNGNVQGVIHQSKWALKRQHQQQLS